MSGRCFPLILLPGLMACGADSGSDSRAERDFSWIDSAGVHISINRGAPAHTDLGWQVDAMPDLVLGGHESPEDFFHRIQGLRVTPDGGVLVVDGGSSELRFYDAEGHLVNRTGGRGRGPGQFGNPVLVPVAGMDSLLVYDTELPWAHVLSAQGEFSRLIHHRHGRPYGARAPVGAVGLQYMLFNSSGIAGGPEAPRPAQGMLQLSQTFLWYDTATGSRLTVDSVLVDHRYYDRQLDWVVPFSPRSSAATTVAGTFITRGSPAEILEYDIAGRLRRIFRIEGFGRPVTPAMIDSFMDSEHARRPVRYGPFNRRIWYSVYSDIGVRDTLPAFRALRMDEDGWLWAEIYDVDPDRPGEWVIFDPQGRVQGRVRTPPGLEIQWIGRDVILGVWRDELGVEHVHRHRLTR